MMKDTQVWQQILLILGAIFAVWGTVGAWAVKFVKFNFVALALLFLVAAEFVKSCTAGG